jgi:hypothetical protein
MVIKKLTNKIIDKMICEVKTPENMKKLREHIADPLIAYTYKQLYPYFIITSVLFILTFILALLIFVLVLRQVIIKM